MDKRQIVVFLGCVIKDGKVLMTLREEKECGKAHRRWELPGGKAGFDERPQEAVKREILEETGVKVKVGPLLPHVQVNYWDYPDFRQKTLIFCFRCELIGGERLTNTDHHIKEVRWVDVKKVKKLDTLPGIKEFVKQASLF